MKINYNQDGLVPAIVQDAVSGQVLMLAYMNEESLQKTLETKETWFFSRSRQQLWHKGETSGNIQQVVDLLYDCDQDTLLVKVVQKGVACHTGKRSCFNDYLLKGEVDLPNKEGILDTLYACIAERKANPVEGSYTNYLFEKGIDKILKKVGEESAETIIAAKNNVPEEIILETCDLAYHVLVMLVDRGITIDQLKSELVTRHVK